MVQYLGAMMTKTEELAKLAALRDQGVLTQAEFEEQKAALLAGPSPAAAARRRPVRAAGVGCLMVIGVLILIVVIGASVGSKKGEAPASGAAGTAAPEPMKVTAIELGKAYEANEAAAQDRYGKQPLLVTGTVAGVDLDIVNKPKVRLRTTNEFLDAQAGLTEASEPQAKTLTKGQSITMLCASVSEIMSAPMLDGCEIK